MRQTKELESPENDQVPGGGRAGLQGPKRASSSSSSSSSFNKMCVLCVSGGEGFLDWFFLPLLCFVFFLPTSFLLPYTKYSPRHIVLEDVSILFSFWFLLLPPSPPSLAFSLSCPCLPPWVRSPRGMFHEVRWTHHTEATNKPSPTK